MSSLGATVDAALKPGTIHAEHEGRAAEVEVVDVDRLGATVRGIRVHVPTSAPLGEQAARLPEAVRTLPDRVVPIEVDPRLGGAVLRSHPKDIVDREYFEVRAGGGEASIARHRVGDGTHASVPFTVTREQLRRLVDDVGDALAPDLAER